VTVATTNGPQNNLGWTTAKLQDVCDIIRGVSFSKDKKIHNLKTGYIGCLRTTNIQNKIEWDDLWYIPREVVKHDRQILQKYDILISSANSIELVGKVAQICDQPILSTLGAFISAIRVKKEINPKFVYFQLSSSKIRQELRGGASTTTNISNISTFSIGNLKLAIAPLSEQARIVSKIEALFSFLDEGTESLRKVQAQLKRYLQAVLKYAFEGKLTEEWRKTQKEKVESASELLRWIDSHQRKQGILSENIDNSNFAGFPKLPETWAWTSMGKLLVDARYGTSQKSFSKPEGSPVLRIPNIVKGRLDLRSLKYTQLKNDEIKRLSVKMGDILVVRTNGSLDLVGRAAAIDELKEDFVFASYLIRLRPIFSENLPKYLNMFLSSETGRQTILEKARTTAGQFNVNLATLRSIPIPLPPLVEQAEIMKIIELIFSVTDKTEEIINKQIAISERLRQSILKDAFAGQLVPQDPNDESAAKLLEIIKADRYNNGKFKMNNQVELSGYVK